MVYGRRCQKGEKGAKLAVAMMISFLVKVTKQIGAV
jgi:hypothetical protein